MAEKLQFEHFAINTRDPVAVANWYCEHLHMSVVRKGDATTQMHFLADSTGRVVLEVYCNPPDQVPDYAAMDPLLLHLAFATDDVDREAARLIAAGATAVNPASTTPLGDRLIMLRDPWGFCVQLCQRAQPMV